MRRAPYLAAVLIAVGCIVGGALVALTGRSSNPGPADVVRAYFAALARGDAPAALGYGNTPAGQHDLLTSEVLAEQQRIAPIRDVRIGGVVVRGSTASVEFSYRLEVRSAARTIIGTMSLSHRDSSWLLARTAIATRVILDRAADRLAFAGSSVPVGQVLLFPGALPVRFDTPFLQLDPATATVGFGGPPTLDVTVQPSAAARGRLLTSLGTLVQSCLDGPRAPAPCPLPSPAAVPGSVHGRLLGGLARQISLNVTTAPMGTIELTGSVAVSVRYEALDFENVPAVQRIRTVLPIDAIAVGVAPLTVQFASTAA